MARTAIHPGEHLAEQLKELGMSAAELGRRLKVPTNLYALRFPSRCSGATRLNSRAAPM